MDTRRRWLQNFRRAFQHATFDFVDHDEDRLACSILLPQRCRSFDS
jgi:hypothetical protein